MLLLMIGSFLLVVLKTGVDWPEMLKGYFYFHVPRTREGITVVLGQLGAAVGVNMTLLYPYMFWLAGGAKSTEG